jgi:hypothetical protein
MKKLGLLSTAAIAATLLFSAPQSSDAITLTAVYDAGELGGSTGFYDPTHGANRRAAFEYALARWSDILAGPNNVTIQVKALFPSMGVGVLGSAGPTTVHRNFSGAKFANTWYPNTVAEALIGSDPNGGTPDISIDFNHDVDTSSFGWAGLSWYYGTDGNPSGAQFDLVTVCMHEIGHGLGFLDLINGDGSWFNLDNPDAYARHLVRQGASPETFLAMNNAQRLSALTSTNVYMDSSITGGSVNDLLFNLMGGRVRIYAPSPFEPGSSISHWDTSLFPNQLMEPALPNGVAIHDPGYAVELFMDLGYTQGSEASPRVSFRQGVAATRTSTIDEGQSVNIDVFLGAPAASNVTIPLSVTGTGVTAGDYTMPTELIIAAGQRKGMFSFQANADAESEGAETATITLGTPTNGTLEGVANNWHRFAVTMNNVDLTSAKDWPLY